MSKLIIICLLFCTLTVSSHAQLGASSIGMLPALGITTSNNCNLSLGKNLIATSVTCRCNCSSVLAVTGLHLEAKRQNKNNVALNWYTLTETNNKGFFVQRSLTGGNHFQTTTFVNGKGNSNRQTLYNLIDINNFYGVTDYRIEQQNNDGTVAYSNVVSVAGMGDNQFVIYPNPASGTVNLLLPSTYSASTATIMFYDASGKKVYQNNYSVATHPVIQINNLFKLATGTYQVSVSSDKDKTLQGKLIIVK